jgi:hypothetical protein
VRNLFQDKRTITASAGTRPFEKSISLLNYVRRDRLSLSLSEIAILLHNQQEIQVII